MVQKDLTVGEPKKVLWMFCLPLLGSIIFQQLYNIADSFVAGKFIGEKALAAVGNGYEITLIFLAFAFGCNIGCSVVAARFLGAKKYAQLKTSVYTTFIGSGVICIILMLLGIFLSDELLNIINTPKDIFEDSKLYLRIYTLGLPFVFYYNISTGIFSALGDSKTPFVFLAVSSLANIFMDILFVTTFKMGVSGVAWATFICQGISFVLVMIFVFFRLKNIETDENVRIFSWEIFAKISKVAVPSILQQSFISVGNIIIQGVINLFGSSVIAGYSASIKLNNLVTTSFTTLGNGISSYTSQNLGAKKYERVKSGLKEGLKLVWIVTIPIVLIYFLLGKQLMNLLIDSPTKEAVTTGVLFLRIVSPFYFVVSTKLTVDGVLRGSALMDKFIISTFTDLILRVLLAIILSKKIGSLGIWISWPIGWVIGMILSIIFVKKSFDKDKVIDVY